MKHIVIAAVGALLATVGTAGTAVSQDRYGAPPPCRDGGPRDGYGVCLCDYEVNFYNPSTPWHVVRAGGPGIRIQAPQIYLRAPEVHVRPSDVIVEPPEIHFEGCPDGRDCEAVAPARGYDGERG